MAVVICFVRFEKNYRFSSLQSFFEANSQSFLVFPASKEVIAPSVAEMKKILGFVCLFTIQCCMTDIPLAANSEEGY